MSNRDRWSAHVSVPAVRKPLSSSKYSWLQTPWTAVKSPPLLITRTWSVPSTTTIFISPSATSSTPSRSIRLIPESRVAAAQVVVGSRGRRGCSTGVPLLLEQVSQAVALGLEGDAGDDWLEETEDDELASLIGRDAPALEVEELRLVDRADGAGVSRPTAVGLVDL